MKTLELECDEIADLKMMRDEQETRSRFSRSGSYDPYNSDANRKVSLLNKIIDHVKASRPEREGLQIR